MISKKTLVEYIPKRGPVLLGAGFACLLASFLCIVLISLRFLPQNSFTGIFVYGVSIEKIAALGVYIGIAFAIVVSLPACAIIAARALSENDKPTLGFTLVGICFVMFVSQQTSYMSLTLGMNEAKTNSTRDTPEYQLALRIGESSLANAESARMDKDAYVDDGTYRTRRSDIGGTIAQDNLVAGEALKTLEAMITTGAGSGLGMTLGTGNVYGMIARSTAFVLDFIPLLIFFAFTRSYLKQNGGVDLGVKTKIVTQHGGGGVEKVLIEGDAPVDVRKVGKDDPHLPQFDKVAEGSVNSRCDDYSFDIHSDESPGDFSGSGQRIKKKIAKGNGSVLKVVT